MVCAALSSSTWLRIRLIYFEIWSNIDTIHLVFDPRSCTFLGSKGPAGLRTTDGATVFPAGITMAATWDRDLW